MQIYLCVYSTVLLQCHIIYFLVCFPSLPYIEGALVAWFCDIIQSGEVTVSNKLPRIMAFQSIFLYTGFPKEHAPGSKQSGIVFFCYSKAIKNCMLV